jgi:predicted murein hydrolase (TIGR00659 family)
MTDWLNSITNLHFSATAIAWLAYTAFVYFLCIFVYRKFNQSAFLHPLLWSTSILLVSLYWLSMSIEQYQQATQLFTFLLGPATVALAIPLYNQLRLLVKMSWRVLVPVAVAGVLAPILSWYSLYLFDAPLNLQMTILVKSITTPLAMDTAQAIGGLSALAAVIVISTGIVGAVCGPALFKLLKINNHAAQGTALGSVAHAIGTAKAISISEQATAFATLALCLNGIMTSVLLPLLFA